MAVRMTNQNQPKATITLEAAQVYRSEVQDESERADASQAHWRLRPRCSQRPSRLHARILSSNLPAGVALDSNAPTNAYSLLMTMLGWLSMTPSGSSRVAITPKVETDGRGELQRSLEAA